MDEICNVFMPLAICQRKIQILFFLVNSVQFVPPDNLFCESFKVFDFIAEVSVVFLLCWLYLGSYCVVQTLVPQKKLNMSLLVDFLHLERLANRNRHCTKNEVVR